MSELQTLESRGQVSGDAAVLYERFFVPALFGQWTDRMLDAAGVGTGARRVLDVACGTGVLARAAAARLGSTGEVIGLDPNPAMLAVARERSPNIEWRSGKAERIDLDDASFDAVTCQFGLMFFDDREAGLREMHRVLRPGARLAVAVWDSLERSPGFDGLARLLDRIVGRAAGDALRVPFSLGDRDTLAASFLRAGMPDAQLSTHLGTACFPSLESWVRTNVRGWAFSELVSDEQLDALIAAAQRELSALADSSGEVVFDAPAHIVVATKA